MKDSSNTAKLLDLPYAPEAEQYLDELERSGQFRIGADAEADEDGDAGPHAEYFWGRGSGSVVISDWWTAGSLDLRVGPGISPADLVLSRVDDSLVIRTGDGLDRVSVDNYLGLIPDASTLRVLFNDGQSWSGAEVLARTGTHVSRVDAAPPAPNH